MIRGGFLKRRFPDGIEGLVAALLLATDLEAVPFNYL
jgi:hypothetical protein